MEHLNTDSGTVNWYNWFGKTLSSKPEDIISLNTPIQLLGIHLQELHVYMHQEIGTRMPIAPPSTIAQIRNTTNVHQQLE